MKQKNFNKQIPPAQLWIGHHAQLVKQAKKELSNLFCSQGGCQKCITCTQIENQQHHSCIWINPEKKYTLDQIEIIFQTIAFKLESKQKLFFILQHADFLTDACSNRLLKSVEEPPQGYHFIFLAQRLGQILPTIQSRCIIKHFYSDQKSQYDTQLITIFKSDTACPPSQFLKILDEEKPNEKESIEMIDHLLFHWINLSNSYITNNQVDQYKNAQTKISHIKMAFATPPMPGSSKIFWRNFYLRFK